MSLRNYLGFRQLLFRHPCPKKLLNQAFSSTRTRQANLCLSIKSNSKLLRHHVHPGLIPKISSRCFWGVDVAFNKVDEQRVKLAGPDRACAEWVLRNGGEIKWVSSNRYVKHYNLLPNTDFESYKIAEIDLRAATVIGMGFLHLENIKHLKVLKLHGCRTIRDDALSHLHFVQDTLEFLNISRCPMITEKGLKELHVLKNLKTMVIYDLIEIKNLDSAVANLKQAMPWCTFDTVDPEELKESETEKS